MASKTTILLAGKPVELVYVNSSTARLQSLKNGAPPSKDFTNPKKALYACCAWIWAMLPKPARADYEDPSEIADAINLDKLGDYFVAIVEAMNAATPSEAGKEAPSSTPGSE